VPSTTIVKKFFIQAQHSLSYVDCIHTP